MHIRRVKGKFDALCVCLAYFNSREKNSMMGRCWTLGWTLVALSKKPKSVNLLDEVDHASPPSKSKPNDQNPDHYKTIHHIHGCPAREEYWKFFCSILQPKDTFSCHVVHTCKNNLLLSSSFI